MLYEEIPITPLDVRCGRVAEHEWANDVLFVGVLPMKPCVEVAADQRGSMRRALPKVYSKVCEEGLPFIGWFAPPHT